LKKPKGGNESLKNSLRELRRREVREGAIKGGKQQICRESGATQELDMLAKVEVTSERVRPPTRQDERWA